MRNRILRMIIWRLFRFLRRYFRSISLIILLGLSVSASANWVQRGNWCSSVSAIQGCFDEQPAGTPCRLKANYNQFCPDQTSYSYEFWNSSNPVCPVNQVWSQEQMQCIDLPSECPGNLTPNIEGTCHCGEDQTPGYKSNPDMTLTAWCFGDPPPDFDPCTPEHPKYIGDVNGQHYCEIDHDCPSDHQMGYVNGEQVCLAPIDDPDPDDPDPNDPDPNDPDPSDPDPNDPDPNDPDNPNSGDFDDSRIVDRLDGVNDRLDQANDHLEGIKDSLDGSGAQFDGSISSGIQSLYESEYPDGLPGVWNARKTDLMNTPVFSFAGQFSFDHVDNTLPEWTICFDIGALGNFGCKSLSLPGYLWAFLSICINLTAAFTCRRLVFGG